MALTKKVLDRLGLPGDIWWTDDISNAYVCETVLGDEKGIGIHELKRAVETLLGDNHMAVRSLRHPIAGDPSSGWVLELYWHGWGGHCAVYPAQSLTVTEVLDRSKAMSDESRGMT